MNTQPTLFDVPAPTPPRARRSDPSTSKAAAQRVDEFAASHFAAILEALKVVAGTIYDIETRAGIDHVAVARRMDELRRMGAVRTTGEQANGPTGRKCRVWERVA